jgi:predicted ABC-type ATPase
METSFSFASIRINPIIATIAADLEKIEHLALTILACIHLASLDLNEARVHQRVSEGGHSVPPDKIRSRLPRTLKNVAVALPLVDEARLLDNSFRDKPFQQVTRVIRGRRVATVESLPAWAAAMLADIP